MEENLTQAKLKSSTTENFEPENSDNSESLEIENFNTDTVQKDGKSLSEDPSNELILGKFKSVDDLSKAYKELQSYQGHCSEELGALRKELSSMNYLKESFEKYNNLHNGLLEIINRDKAKYTSPEYFENPTFREIYKEALLSFGTNLDTEKLINLLDSYANARIFANDKKKAAQSETQKVLETMTYENNSKSTFVPPKKRFDEMTTKEIDDLLDRLI